MKKIGMLVAVEIGSVLSKYGKASEEIEKFGFKVYKYEMPQYELYVVHSGAGEIAAAAATQLLIAVYGVEAVVNFGVVGGLTEDMKLSKTVVVEKVVHYDFDVSAIDHVEVGRYTSYPEVYIPLNKGLIEMALQVEPSLKRVACASADKFVDGRENKSRIAQQFGADICEMELAAIVLTCDGGAEEFGRTVNEAADVCLRVTDKIIANM